MEILRYIWLFGSCLFGRCLWAIMWAWCLGWFTIQSHKVMEIHPYSFATCHFHSNFFQLPNCNSYVYTSHVQLLVNWFVWAASNQVLEKEPVVFLTELGQWHAWCRKQNPTPHSSIATFSPQCPHCHSPPINSHHTAHSLLIINFRAVY